MRPSALVSGSLLGVDMGSAAVKIVELSRSAEGCRVNAWAVAALPANTVHAGNISDVAAVGDAIRRAVKDSGCRTRRAAAAVAGSATATRTIALDAALTDAELEVEVALEAERSLPFGDADIAVDFQALHLSADNPSRVDVLLTACRQEHVAVREAALQRGGLKAVAMDVETHCLHRAVYANWPDAPPDTIVALLDLGATVTSLTVLTNDAVLFARDEPFDASGLAESKLPPAVDATQPWSAGSSAVAAVLQLASRLLRLGEAALGKPVPRLLIAGGCARIAGLAELAAERLQRAVEVANPFAGMAVAEHLDAAALQEQAPALMTACGLALFDADAAQRNA